MAWWQKWHVKFLMWEVTCKNITCDISHAEFKMWIVTREISHVKFLMWKITCENSFWVHKMWNFTCESHVKRMKIFCKGILSCLLPQFQSGFRRHHSTESALLRVLSDIFSATDKGEVSLLDFLDVSAAFDTVDHSILLDRLSISYGISGSAFDWMQSFIVGCTQSVHYGGSVSRRAQLRSGIAQGSVLGPILYVLYTADVQKLVESFGFGIHLYADDTQFHDSCKPTDAVLRN